MRITGGKLKGRYTDTPNGKMAIRPAMDRMRESLFDIIGRDLPGKSFLDLFSGIRPKGPTGIVSICFSSYSIPVPP